MFKAILPFALLVVAVTLEASSPCPEFFQAIRNYTSVFRSLEAMDVADGVSSVNEVGLELKESWANTKPFLDEYNPELAEYLNGRAALLVVATYMIQYNPGWDTVEPVIDKHGNVLIDPYDETWKEKYHAASAATPQSYTDELTQQLSHKYPDASFIRKNGLLYVPEKDMSFLVDAISISLIESAKAMLEQEDLIEINDPESRSRIVSALQDAIDDILVIP
ncbi:hypothetical protein [Cerasicoccus fimbriatus]|uniref:hypothetical protein n=1 Tax=Cerasicoccus fimbriatus TaxID=3014554 RepID=UPI0022B5579D|nr:hypothetical protein [Cerasicoccus sp. TK19100]